MRYIAYPYNIMYVTEEPVKSVNQELDIFYVFFSNFYSFISFMYKP